MNGWIKLYRELLDSNIWHNTNDKQKNTMITCLLLANHTPNKWEWQGKTFTVNSGQFITSYNSLAQKCNVSKQNIRTALNKLKMWEFLTLQSTHTGLLITITNWDKYQGKDVDTNTPSNTKLTHLQHETNTQLTPNKNVKNVKNVKNTNIVFDENKFLIDEEYLKILTEKFPDIDIDKEILKMEAWLIAHPERRYKKYLRFITSWLGRIKPVENQKKVPDLPYL